MSRRMKWILGIGIPVCGILLAAGALIVIYLKPVSYTHLDVYKRQGAISVLSGRPEPVRRLSLPPAPLPGEERVDRLLLIVDKTAPTPPAYPRPPAKIAKKPLYKRFSSAFLRHLRREKGDMLALMELNSIYCPPVILVHKRKDVTV